jgi:hypothetical protein
MKITALIDWLPERWAEKADSSGIKLPRNDKAESVAKARDRIEELGEPEVRT